MPKFNRIVATLAPVALVGGALAGVTGAANSATATPTGVLPAAIARPVDVTFIDTLHAGETLSELLDRVDLAPDETTALLDELSGHHDPRRMRPGSVVTYRRSVESGTVRRLDFRLDADRTLNLRRAGDAWIGAIEEVEITVDTIVVAGTVRSSLYDALVAEGTDRTALDERNRLVDQLADRIFAWQIDFSRDLRSGDEFRVLYERLVRPDGSTRSVRVLGAQMSINSRDFEAYAFSLDEDREDYFNREGESLRRSFLRAPLQYRRISSAFNRSRFHPILKTTRAHNGIDYAASSGTPVYAVGDGVIQRAGNGGGYGNVVDIDHNRGMMTRYAHLRGFAKGIRAGVAVKQGDLIGYVGMTGQATGPHLHYEFHRGGRPIDPNTIDDTNGEPVPQSYTAQFLDRVREYAASLDIQSPPVLAADRRPGIAVSDD